jgi:high-affinity iron transporter
MFASAIIVFREVLEAALIIGIIAAATRSIPRRGRWLAAGVAAGLLGSGVVAGSADVISNLANGAGQELFNAGVLAVAVVMLAWHNIWMASHGAELAASARNVGENIREGTSELSALLVIVGLAVLREGSETVLFLYSIAVSSGNSAGSMVTGGLIGVGAGVLVGYLLYAGLLRIPLRWFFTATSLLVLLLAAGMASQAARFLIQADLIPSLASPLWDTSSVLSDGSWPGMLLHSLVGYDSRPAGMQIVFYVVALVVIGSGMKWVGGRQRTRRAPSRPSAGNPA